MLSLLGANWSLFLLGFWNTILCSLISLFFSLIIGSGFAILETVPNKFWRAVAKVYVEIFRNISLAGCHHGLLPGFANLHAAEADWLPGRDNRLVNLLIQLLSLELFARDPVRRDRPDEPGQTG